MLCIYVICFVLEGGVRSCFLGSVGVIGVAARIVGDLDAVGVIE